MYFKDPFGTGVPPHPSEENPFFRPREWLLKFPPSPAHPFQAWHNTYLVGASSSAPTMNAQARCARERNGRASRHDEVVNRDVVFGVNVQLDAIDAFRGGWRKRAPHALDTAALLGAFDFS